MTTLKNVIKLHTLLYNNIEKGEATDQKEHEEHSTRDQHVPGFCEGHVKDLGQDEQEGNERNVLRRSRT